MQIPLQITVRDVPQSEAVEARIRQKVDKLEEFFSHIISCRVVVEAPHKHHHQGKQYTLRIDIGVPGHEIVVNRDHHEDVFVALRDGFDAAKRQLDEYARRNRRETKVHAPERVGRVLRLSREEGIGFIAGQDGTEHYFDRANVVSPRFEQLKEGDEVKFIEEIAGEGAQAKRVSIGHHHEPE
ncbi:ribosomal pseudouridine synthase [Ferrigenium kumadai]|uniref:Ribosomal pseudouridine synthase n=1 Tax=Ferrigenium kumadai TaxID=1682490 RepID=A0AAN1VZ67_9PROT|nr:HPF/RaiA family ribosome-associated protein [Ferrigenium kumadai]BBI98930.1 ribosomal pseudouridine synthase [Ferrigenium kumadai]